MATFRSGFKIVGELTLRQSFGRMRSFSEDRKPGSWLPEDQWAVRPPCTTCPDPCTPKKPPKPSKSWLSICKDPEPPLPCDIRHNNCPPPQKNEEPWYAFITKKKPEKPKPPLDACRMEAQREAENAAEEYCEDMEDGTWPGYYEQLEPPEPICAERPPAPVIRLSCPPPKDLDLMLWCGRPGLSVARIASQCQSDRMPYEEFRPRKTWKPPPFSLPAKKEAPPHQPFCSNVGRAPLSEYKQVDIPKPLYTRYKSVELEDEHFLLCMTDARCPNEESSHSLAIQPPPLRKPQPPPEKPKPDSCPEKPVLVAASRKPVKLKCAPKLKFRPKPTKLVERRHYRNPCAQHKACDLSDVSPLPEFKSPSDSTPPCEDEAPKVITGTLTDEPQTYQRDKPSRRPPNWMFMLSKPGSKDTPLVPHADQYPSEPDWCGETDGLKFYDGQDEGIHPKPPPDPCRRVANQPDAKSPTPPCPQSSSEDPPAFRENFVLMPEHFNIKNMRPPEEYSQKNLQEASFQEFIDAKTSNVRGSKLSPQMKENILYDLVRNSPMPPFDPMKADPPPRRPPEPECPQPKRFYYRRYSTFSPLRLRKPEYANVLNRTKSEDSGDKCKPRKLVPPTRDCPPPKKGLSCNETELPCCPKARVPPRCDVKRPLPPCKKKLAPKPSYSECSKDPPPCPRITECNAWEKRDLENQKKGPSRGRRFSNWAPAPENASAKNDFPVSKAGSAGPNPEGLTAPGPSYSEYLDLKDRGQSLNKNIRSSHKQRKVFSGKELMLNFVNPAEDTNSYYKSDSLVRRRKPQWGKLKITSSGTKKSDASVGNQLHEKKVISALLQDHHTRNDIRINNLRLNGRESSLAASNRADANFPKAIIGSVGSWINGLIKAQRNRSKSCPPTLGRAKGLPTTAYVETVDVDRIMKLTKPFERKIKSRSFENFCYYPKDSGCREQKKIPSPFRRIWGRNRNRSLAVFPKYKRERARSSMWRFESLSPSVNFVPNTKPDHPMPGKTVRNNNGDQSLQRTREKNDLLSRLDVRKFEEYSLPTVENLGRTLLLNVKGSLYDTRPGMDQFYTKNSLRCYTAVNHPNTTEWKNEKLKSSAARRTISRFSVTSRGASTFSKIRKPKFIVHLKRTETQVSTDLVQDLIKKIKVSRAPPNKKIDGPETTKTDKTKFRQSATSSMVASVIARKESEAGRIAHYTSAEKALVPLALPPKSWIYIDRGYDKNMKYDLKKSIAHATVIKSKPKKWLQDVENFQSDSREFLYDGKKKKKSREHFLKEDLKYCADKSIKRQEVKNMLSKLELKKNVLKVAENPPKLRQKEQNRKEIMNILEHRNADKEGGRFGWQHALFRNRQIQNQNVVEISEDRMDLSAVKSLIDIKEARPEMVNASLSEGNIPKKVNNNVELYEPDLDIVQCEQLDDSLKLESRKNSNLKDAEVKLRFSKLQKNIKGRERDKLTGGFAYENRVSLENNRDSRSIIAAIARPEVNPTESLQAVLHTRRYATKTPDTTKPGAGKCGCQNTVKRDKKKNAKECESSKEEIMCPEKKNCKKNEETEDDCDCRIGKVKKPGPNCPDG